MDVILSSSVRRWRITGVTWLLMTRITAKQFTFNMYSDSKYIYYTNGQSQCISWWTSTDTHSFINQSSIPSSAFEILSLLQVLQLVLKFPHKRWVMILLHSDIICLTNNSQQGISYSLKLTHIFKTTHPLPASAATCSPWSTYTQLCHLLCKPHHFEQQLTTPTIHNLLITLVLPSACSSLLGLPIYGYSSPNTTIIIVVPHVSLHAQTSSIWQQLVVAYCEGVRDCW